jgi:nucleotide-binding universal stress UspA family protein
MKELDVDTRIQLNNILFATDFSPAADAAAPYATGLAKRYGATLHALHVRPPVINPMTPPESWEGLEEAAEVETEIATRKLLDILPGIQPEILINEGDLWSNISAAIEECHIDLLVVGTRGRSGIRKLLLGSIAEEIFRASPCPVLTVGPYLSAEPSRAGTFTHILFATDFSAESLAAAPYAVSLAQEYEAHLTLLHVIEEPKVCDLVHPSELRSPSLRLLHELLPPRGQRQFQVDRVVECGRPAEKILEFAVNSRADLIVLGVRQPRGLSGPATHLPFATAHKIVSQAGCPTLTVCADRWRNRAE